MELNDAAKNALAQLLAQKINANLLQMSITHTNKDRGNMVSPAQWNAAAQKYPKQLFTAITCSAGVANGNLVIQIWLGYDVKPNDGSTPPSTTSRLASIIAFGDMEAGVDDTGSNGDYPVVFESGTTPPVRYFALEPGGPDPTNVTSQEPKYPVYGNIGSTFPVPGAGAITT